ncbi:MAG: PAS domain S-box protein [Deltaproteobacteria bacterium]|nr:PAS domain S-box protein [Deltaproteobacteria bacterium]
MFIKSEKEGKGSKALPKGLIENIFKSMPTPFYVIDANTYDLIISKAAKNFYPFSTKEKCHSFFHSKDQPCHFDGDRCLIEEVKSSKKSQKKEHFHYDIKGALTFYEINAHPIFNENNDVSHVILNYFDVTALKHFQERLSKSEETYRTLVQSIHGYLYSIRYAGLDKPQVYHSPQCEQITGYSPEEYARDSHLWIKMVHPGDVELVADFFSDLMKKGKSKRIEHRIIHKKGNIIWVLNQCTVTTNDMGETERADGIILDITEKKKAEDSLKNSEKMHRNIISTTMEGYCRFNSNYEITDTNDAICKMLGHKNKKFMGKNMSCLVHEDKQGFFLENITRIEKEDQINFEIDLKTRKGASIPTIISATAIRNPENNFSFGFAFFTDISKRRSAEKALIEAKEKAEEATEIKDKFVSLVAHDLKGPLTAIWGYLQILYEDAEDDTSTKKFVAEAMASCQDMTTLINEILSVSRLKTGHLTPRKSFLDAKKLMEQVVHNFSSHAAKKGVTLINAIAENKRIYADEKLFFEVIRNLISNAIKFSTTGGSITVFIPGSEPATIAVSDTGVGMPSDYIAHIFKYEEKTSTKGTADESGTGLGLPLAKDIMLAHGGDLTAETNPGKGSTFYAKLPDEKPKVLVVEDEEFIARSIGKILSPLNVQIDIALNVPDAEKIISKTPPHLVLLDILIPEINGFQLLEEIMSRPDTRNIPVIVITGDPDIETKNKSFQMGAIDFIAKPFRTEDILPRVRRFTC